MSMATVNRIRGFLLQIPRPTVVRVSTADGGNEELKVGKQSFVRLAESVVAIGPELIECMDKQGNLIRAFRNGEPDATRSEAAEIPAGLQADPQALLLTHFSNLLHRAYEHSTEIAFNKLVELVDRIDSRSDAIEQRLERAESDHRKALREQIDMEFERADEAKERSESQNPQGEMLNAFMQGAMAQGGPTVHKANGSPSNGKAD